MFAPMPPLGRPVPAQTLTRKNPADKTRPFPAGRYDKVSRIGAR